MHRPAVRTLGNALTGVRLRPPRRLYSAAAAAAAQPRHLMSMADLTPAELTALVRSAAAHKRAVKAGSTPAQLAGALSGRTVAMMFSKRSTRTRVSTKAAVALMGGHPMFLGKDDIQLGVKLPRTL